MVDRRSVLIGGGSVCQRQSKIEPKGIAKCCHFGVGMIAAQARVSIRAAALVRELAVARMLWPFRAKYLRCWSWVTP